MSSFSAVDAATEGFRLIGRRPGTVAVWAIVWLVIAFGPVLAMAGVIVPHLTGLVSELRDLQDAGPGAFARIMQFQAGLWSVMAPWMLWLFIAQTILYAAIFRAVLEPKNPGFAYLRLGMDEVRLFLLQIILFLLWIAFVCAVTLAAVAVFMLSRQAGGAAAWINVLAALLLAALCIYVPVRLSLAGPMTFARKRIEVFGSWRRTRGRFWSLVLMFLAVVVFAVVLGVVAGAIEKGLIAALGDWSAIGNLERVGDDPMAVIQTVLRALGPGLIAVLVIQGIAGVLTRLIGVAALASAYRTLGGGAATEAAAPGALAAHA